MPCLLLGTLGQGWEFLATTEDNWNTAHHQKLGTDPDDEPEEAADPIPDMPVIDNPGYFTIASSWKKVRILQEREIHFQNIQSYYLWKTDIEQVINLELTEVIPKDLLSDCCRPKSNV